MRKHLAMSLALFMCMCLVGGSLAVFLPMTAQAEPNYDQCDLTVCQPTSKHGIILTCDHYNCGELYAIYECWGSCPGGGFCDCHWAACWAGYGC